MAEISKKKFDEVNNKHLANKWTIGTFNFHLKYKRIIIYFLLVLILLGLFSTIFNLSNQLIAVPTIIFLIVFGIMVSNLLIVLLFNNVRINKIRKELGITKIEYDFLVKKYSS